MLFYVRKDCRTKENLPNDKLAVSIEERIDISNIVMNDGIRMTGLLGREDITSTLRGARLNGQTLDACLQTLALQDGKDIICFNSYLFELLQNNDITKAVVKKALHTANVKTADVILLPVFRSAGVGHYALMIIYPQLCLMVYADSLLPGVNAEVRNTFMVCLSLMWSFYPKISLSNFSRRYAMVCTDEIERQDDDVSCGIFTCLNAYRFINANKFGVVCRDELKRLRHWICAKGRVATPQVGKASNIARKEYRFIKNKLVELEIQTRLPLGYLQLRMGKPAAALIEKCPIWEQLGRLMQKETLPNYDSDSTDEGNEIFVTAIRRPIEVDMDLFNKCAEELAKIESFSEIDDQAIQARRSDRIKALILLSRGLFRALSEKELLSITESIQQMGISNLLFNTARKLGKKWLTDRNMMAKTCRLGMALLDRVIVPELITEYLAKRYNLRRNELTQEITMGTEGQLLYHVHLKEQECTIARKKITNEDTLYQVIAGKLTDEEVGAIVVGLNQYLEAEESEFLDMMPHEMLRKHLLTETAGRVDQGTVLHVENSDEKHSWSTIFVIEPVYDHEQRRSCINSLEAVVQKCMKIVVEKKLRSIAFAVNPGPNKNWDVHLRLKIITEAVRSQLSKLRSEQGQYISVAIVRFVAENDYFANVAREFISTL